LNRAVAEHVYLHRRPGEPAWSERPNEPCPAFSAPFGATMPVDGGNSDETLAWFAAAKIDVRALSAQLQDEDAKSFVNSWNALMGVIPSKSAVLKRAS
jgi:hypothetical protein